MYICDAARGSYIVNHSALGCRRVGEGETGVLIKWDGRCYSSFFVVGQGEGNAFKTKQ